MGQGLYICRINNANSPVSGPDFSWNKFFYTHGEDKKQAVQIHESKEKSKAEAFSTSEKGFFHFRDPHSTVLLIMWF